MNGDTRLKVCIEVLEEIVERKDEINCPDEAYPRMGADLAAMKRVAETLRNWRVYWPVQDQVTRQTKRPMLAITTVQEVLNRRFPDPGYPFLQAQLLRIINGYRGRRVLNVLNCFEAAVRALGSRSLDSNGDICNNFLYEGQPWYAPYVQQEDVRQGGTGEITLTTGEKRAFGLTRKRRVVLLMGDKTTVVVKTLPKVHDIEL